MRRMCCRTGCQPRAKVSESSTPITVVETGFLAAATGSPPLFLIADTGLSRRMMALSFPPSTPSLPVLRKTVGCLMPAIARRFEYSLEIE